MRRLSPAVAAVFDPVQAPTTFEETVERLGQAIRLALLPPGSRLPPERELAEQLGISRSTLRQALTALTQTGHLVATRGRFGGTFVAEHPPLTETGGVALEGRWRELLDYRVAVETGAAVLAAERATAQDLARLAEPVAAMKNATDFPAYRRADVFFHLGLAEAAHAPRLVAAMTEVQAGMSELIGHIAHPPAVLERSNAQHARLVAHLERRDGGRAVRLVREHLEGTEHILAGLMPQSGG
jgi:DNA-binding FadR family transcriptional regulator